MRRAHTPTLAYRLDARKKGQRAAAQATLLPHGWSCYAANMDDVSMLETILSLCVGIGVSAACGFRVFLPPLALGIAQRMGLSAAAALPEWLSSTPMLLALACAALVEIGAYYIPWVDNALDTIASPAAVIAGVLLTAGMLDGVSPGWKWTLAIVAGGGAAGITQAATVVTRGLSTATSGGVTNAVVSTGESAGALMMVLLAIVIAPLAAALFVLVVVWFVRLLGRWRRRPTAASG